jgi:hypothetical protein
MLTALVAGALSLGSADASAQDHSMDCGFSGLVGTADPFLPHEHAAGVESVATDLANSDHGGHVLLDQDHGRYTFSGNGTCVIDDGGPQRVATVTISSTGVYANTVCSTGNASAVDGRTNAEEGTGFADWTSVREGQSDLFNDVAYDIDFTGGNGVLEGTADHNLDDRRGALTGFVRITPQVGNCLTTDVQVFQVAGSFHWAEGTPGVGPNAPQNTSPPTISGTAREGETLTASPGSWSGNPAPVAFLYQWQRCSGTCADITGAKSQSYKLTRDDVGKTILVQVTAVGAGVGGPVSSAQTSTVVAAPPVGQASAQCATENPITVPDQHALGQVDFWLWVSQPSTGRIHVCVRARAGTQVVGGRLEVTTSGSPGIGPHISTGSTDVSLAHCPQQIHESGSIDRIYSSAPGSTPIKLCVTVLGTSQRIEIGTTSGPTSPFVRWVSDSDSPPPPVTQFP